jgi:hypothetical protein
MDNVSPEAIYLQKGNIITPLHTHATTLDQYGLTTAATAHRTKSDAEATAQEARGRTRLDEISLGSIAPSGGSIRKGR